MFWDQVGRHGVTYLSAEGIARGATYVIFIWLATVTTVADFGLLNVFVSLLSMLGVAVGLGVPDALLRFHFSDDDFRPVLGMAVALPVGLGVGLLLAVTPWQRSAGAALNIPGSLLVLAVAGAPAIAVRQGWLAVLRARRESSAYFRYRLLEPVTFGLAIVVLAALGASLGHERTTAAYLAAVVAAALVATGAATRHGLTISAMPVRRVLSVSVPFVFHSFAMTGLAVFDQIMIQQLIGPVAAGTYAFAYRFGMAMHLLVFAVTAAWTPLLMEHLRQGSVATIRPAAVMTFRILVASSVMLAWILPPLAKWTGGEAFAGSIPLIPLIVYAYLWTGFYGLALAYVYMRDRALRLVAISGSAFLVNAVLNYLAIPRWGVTAAAVTTLIGYGFLALLMWRAVARHRSELPWGRFLVELVLAAPLVLAAIVYYS